MLERNEIRRWGSRLPNNGDINMICAYEDCNNEFEAKTHNQKYCSDECCKIATNVKIKEKYQTIKDRKAGIKFKCKNRGCNQILNRYSNGDECEVCKAKRVASERKNILEMLNGSS
jgi:hypothetical protein